MMVVMMADSQSSTTLLLLGAPPSCELAAAGGKSRPPGGAIISPATSLSSVLYRRFSGGLSEKNENYPGEKDDSVQIRSTFSTLSNS